MANSIILDCDPGHDDVLALFLAAGSPAIDLVAVTTVAGNQTIEKVTRNALAAMAKANIRVPVAQGAALPLVQEQIVAPDIHGESGLDGPELPEPQQDLDGRHAVDLIIDEVMARPAGTLTLVPIGPLTNIALAVRKAPEIVERVKEVVLMGGSYTRGNRTPTAEFNIMADPEAADIVFNQDWKVTMVGLDLTHQAVATPQVRRRIAAIDSPLATFVSEILDHFSTAYMKRQGFADPPVHDMCAVAKVADPAVFVTVPGFVAVELTGTWTRGQTVVDFAHLLGREHRAQIATELDWKRLWDMEIEAITALSGSTRENGQIL